jgi:hypothetical protein
LHAGIFFVFPAAPLSLRWPLMFASVIIIGMMK